MRYTLRDGVLFACAASILILSYSLQPTSVIGRDLHTSLSGGEVVSSFDTHNGFQGDGKSCTIVSFEDDAFLQRIQQQPNLWKPFPPDETVKTLLYGVYADEYAIAPSVTGKDSPEEPLIPPIEKGYYLLEDRHSEAKENTDLLDRSSYNFTLSVYDADNRMLYYYKLDT